MGKTLVQKYVCEQIPSHFVRPWSTQLGEIFLKCLASEYFGVYQITWPGCIFYQALFCGGQQLLSIISDVLCVEADFSVSQKKACMPEFLCLIA